MKLLTFLLLLVAPLTWAETAPDTAKPWTRWWWLGSGVDEKNLTRQLEAFAEAGIGGVEICPIYGAKGYEDRDLEFLSDEWIAMLDHTSSECARLGLGLDLTTGTGWPFGGPWVTPEMASHSLVRVEENAAAGAVEIKLPEGDLICLLAYPESGQPIDLSKHVKNGALKWTTSNPVRIRGLATKSPIQKVKRAAPGGAGSVLDPFSPSSLEEYLKPFTLSLRDLKSPQPRAHFHDSFEYYHAAWTPRLLQAFKAHAGYDLRSQLPAFFGEGDPDTVARVTHDYRSTLDWLHRRYLREWNEWAKKRGSLTRNQAHGSPGNVLDHYAVADIPETEIFRHVEDNQIPMLQFAASAAHLTGKTLVSAESFTWLGEHFQVKPEALKEAADFLWLGGVNHLFFHGIPYSPADAGWPGWLFYASTHMGENGGLWRDLPEFNRYIHAVQSELQKGTADTAVLLYFPVHDQWSKPADKLPLFTIHNQNEWLHGTSFHKCAMTLWENGIPCDFASNSLLAKAEVKDGKVVVGDAAFETLLLPALEYLPAQSARKVLELSAAGAPVAFLGDAPTKVPGFLRKDREDLAKLTSLPQNIDLLDYLEKEVFITPEPMASHGLRFVRRKTEDGHSWFIVNKSDKAIDARIPLSKDYVTAYFSNPAVPNRGGIAGINNEPLHFVMAPGESRLLRTYTATRIDGSPWVDDEPEGDPIAIDGPWKIEFLAGGPELPEAAEVDQLASWTELSEAARNFSGTARYTTTFLAKPGTYRLDLGQVAETCRVTLNGKPVGTSFFPPRQFNVSQTLVDGENTLTVEVTNLAANRIADADRRKVNWKSFHEINFVNIDYKPFDASGWKPLPSGLIGPVRLIPLSSN